jgi:hypothetical protein
VCGLYDLVQCFAVNMIIILQLQKFTFSERVHLKKHLHYETVQHSHQPCSRHTFSVWKKIRKVIEQTWIVTQQRRQTDNLGRRNYAVKDSITSTFCLPLTGNYLVTVRRARLVIHMQKWNRWFLELKFNGTSENITKMDVRGKGRKLETEFNLTVSSTVWRLGLEVRY